MTIHEIAKRHNLYVIEDNAHGLDAKHDGRFLGTFGDISTFSFDHLKNISCGQGGGIAINNKELLDKFHIHYEFGTNRKIFFQGGAERYEWKNVGSNYLLSELNAAMLYAQLEIATSINAIFVKRWKQYAAALEALVVSKKIELPLISKKDLINGHCFFIKTKNQEERSELISFLQTQNIQAQFHYVPLHKSEFGKRAGRFAGEDTYTTNESSRLLRLPLFYNITEEEVNYVAESIKEFYR
jgi:dTDP-4-amino-4,6-dideoxygalactose transaminase